MQILQVVHALPAATSGGTELYTQWLAETLAGDHDVAVATPRGTETSVDGVTVYALPDTDAWTDPTGARSGLERSVVDQAVDEAFTALLRELEPDVVHFQHLQGTSATLPERCRERGVPAVLTLHDLWTQCHRTQLHRPDGRQCAGPESIEKCTACYADALERADRRAGGLTGHRARDETDDRTRERINDGARGEDSDGRDGDVVDASPGVDPSERTLPGSGARDDGDGADGYAPPSIDEIDRGWPTDEWNGEGATEGQDRAGDTIDFEDTDGFGDTDDFGDTNGFDSRSTDSDPFERSYDLEVSDRPELGFEELHQTVARRTDRLDAALDATDLLIAPSAFLRDRFVDVGVPAEHLVHCRPGVLVDDYDDTGFDADEGVALGYAGQLTPENDVHVLVEAYQTLDGDATLHLFGTFEPATNDYHARLRDAAAGERVTFHGSYQDRSTPFEWIDAIVVSSLYAESRPIVVQEAFASNVPVVAGDESGTAALVTDGEDGLTYSSGDPVALAECLQAIVDEPATIERLREGIERPTSMAEHARHVAFLYEVCADEAVESVPDVDLPS